MTTTPILSFKEGGGDVVVDLPRLLATRLLVQGSSGSGKTHTMFALLQETFGRVQHFIIDRESDFVPLRQHFPYILIGAEGDIPIDLKTKGGVETLVRKILELKANVIVDLSDTPEPQKQEYVRRVAHELANLPRSSGLWTPLLFVIDELQKFAIESGKGSSVATLELADLATLGRKRGFCMIGATSRMAKLSKDVAALLENKLILRTGAVDAARAVDELDMKKLAKKELRSLPDGVGYGYGPAIAIDPVLVRTRGNLKVSPLKQGELRPPPPPAPAKLQAMMEQFKAVPVEAEKKAKTEEDLRKEVAELTRRIRQFEAGAGKAAATPVVDERAIARAIDAAVKTAIAPYQKFEHQVKRVLAKATTHATEVVNALTFNQPIVETADRKPVGVTPQHIRRPAPPPVSVSRRPRDLDSDRETSIGKGERKVLAAIAQYPDGVSREQLTVLTGYKRSSRDTYVQRLSAAGLVEVRGNQIFATDAGIEELGSDFEPLPTGEELREHWLQKLPEGERKILSVLIEAYPDPVAREDLSDATGYKRSSRDTYLQRLGSRKLIESDRDGVRASAILFE